MEMTDPWRPSGSVMCVMSACCNNSKACRISVIANSTWWTYRSIDDSMADLPRKSMVFHWRNSYRDQNSERHGLVTTAKLLSKVGAQIQGMIRPEVSNIKQDSSARLISSKSSQHQLKAKQKLRRHLTTKIAPRNMKNNCFQRKMKWRMHRKSEF